MGTTCSECGEGLTFRTERFSNGKYYCQRCLNRVEPKNIVLSSAQERFGLVLASRGDRLIAQILDGVITIVLFFLFTWKLHEDSPGWLVALDMLPGLVYFLFADALPGGQSLGKRVLKIAVVDSFSGVPCKWYQSLGRNLFGFLGIFDWIFIFGKNKQRLGDMLANTIVILKSPQDAVEGMNSTLVR